MITERQADHLRKQIGGYFSDSFLFGHPRGGEDAGVYGLAIQQGPWDRPTVERMIYSLRRHADRLERQLEDPSPGGPSLG